MNKVALELGLTSTRFEGNHMSNGALATMEQIKKEDRSGKLLEALRSFLIEINTCNRPKT